MDTPTPIPASRARYVAPGLVDLGPATEVTLGKYAEDTQDEGRYFE
ncbi:MAG: putative RiPP precursor [Nocardiopsaceae bacterium]|nr:putative RiPP precursor [Nocardiopsaceae bacterium]